MHSTYHVIILSLWFVSLALAKPLATSLFELSVNSHKPQQTVDLSKRADEMISTMARNVASFNQQMRSEADKDKAMLHDLEQKQRDASRQMHPFDSKLLSRAHASSFAEKD